MEGFVDLHCHILPGVDDGAGDMADALALIDMALADGTRALVLTPHYRGRFRQNTPEQLQAVFMELRQRASDRMALYLANEAGYERELTDKLAEGRVLTLNGSRYVLLELPVDITATQAQNAVREVADQAFVPILAHVERYDAFARNKFLIDRVLDMGALIQINADSVMGEQGFGTKRFCHWLLKSRRAHFVASDAHDLKYRPPKLRACHDHVSKKYGEEYAAALFRENARVVLAGEQGIGCYG